MSKIAVIGTGRVAGGLAGKLVAAGHDVMVGGRDPAEVRKRWPHAETTVMEIAEAIGRSDIIFNATPGDTTLELFTPFRDALEGKILVDVSNATRRGADGLPSGLYYAEGSLAGRLQDALPGTAIVKTLNTMLFTVMTSPESLAAPPTAYLSGNDVSAKATVRALLHDLGWRDDWIQDLGGIASAQGTEAMVLLVPHILKATGFAPFAISIAR